MKCRSAWSHRLCLMTYSSPMSVRETTQGPCAFPLVGRLGGESFQRIGHVSPVSGLYIVVCCCGWRRPRASEPTRGRKRVRDDDSVRPFRIAARLGIHVVDQGRLGIHVVDQGRLGIHVVDQGRDTHRTLPPSLHPSIPSIPPSLPPSLLSSCAGGECLPSPTARGNAGDEAA
jgi:hypothetical protein